MKDQTMTERRSSFTKDDLLACGRGELFGPGNAQLPLPPMLMFDRITQISEDGGPHGKGMIRAEFDINPDLWFFPCHFKGDPVMPGCLGLDALWQLTGFFLGWLGEPGKGRALGVGEVKLAAPVRTVILRPLASWATPPTSFVTTSSFFFNNVARSSSTPVSLMPWAAACERAKTNCSEEWSSALLGMQPTLRQVPPRVPRLSMRATLRPSCAARNAQT